MLTEEYNTYYQAVKSGDFFIQEILVSDWMPYWKVVGKTKYLELSLKLVELFNKKLSLEELEVLRRNFGVQMSNDGHFMALMIFVRC